MEVFVSGGTGFVGRALVPELRAAGHRVVLLVRPGRAGGPDADRVVAGDPCAAGPWQAEVGRCDAAINLVGEPVSTRWNARARALIRDTRLASARNLAAAVPRDRPFVLVNGSAVGYYGDAGDRVLREDAPAGRDFLARVVRDAEVEALAARRPGVRVVLPRLGVVLDAGGGALERLEDACRRRRAGTAGTGRQWVSWVHRADCARALRFLLERGGLDGPVNLCAPEPVRQAEFFQVLARELGWPAAPAVPAFAVRLALGDAADVVLFSQRMDPRRLLAAGFRFRYPDLASAAAEIRRSQDGSPP